MQEESFSSEKILNLDSKANELGMGGKLSPDSDEWKDVDTRRRGHDDRRIATDIHICLLFSLFLKITKELEDRKVKLELFGKQHLVKLNRSENWFKKIDLNKLPKTPRFLRFEFKNFYKDHFNILIVSTRKSGYGETYRSTDGGESWELVLQGPNLISMEFNTSNSNQIYAVTTGTSNMSAAEWSADGNVRFYLSYMV